MTDTAAAPLVRSARKPKGDGHLRRAEIIAAAERIFVREGYEGATIRKIADEVGVSSTALYLHFRDKSEMLLEICQGAFQSLAARNLAMLAEPVDSVERVRRMLDSYMEFALANPNAYWLVFSRAPTTPNATLMQERLVVQELGRQCYERFEAALGRIAAEGRLVTAPDLATQALWAAAHGLASLLTTRPNFPWADHLELRRTLIDGLLRGLVRAPS